MSTSTQVKRFVNLGTNRVYVQDPQGRTIPVFPFQESLTKNRRDGGIYVCEGEFWARYVSEAGPLYPFPRPVHYGVDAFPAMRLRREDGSEVALDGSEVVDANVLSAPGPSVAASVGRFRAKGDVIRDGKKVVEDPATGKIHLIDDPGPPAGSREEMKKGIEAYLADLGVETYRDFQQLSDDVLLAIPGITSANLPQLRKNVTELLRRMEGVENEDPTPVREDAPAPASRQTSFEDLMSDADDEEPAKPMSKKATKKKRAAKKATKKTSRRKRST